MFSLFPHAEVSDYRQFAIWLLTIVVSYFGLRAVKEIMGVLLEKLYQYFIQSNSAL